MNHYVLLGVSSDADSDTIRSAFRALVRRYHPDAGEGSSAHRFREIVEAYETLTDPVRRRRYDATLEPARPFPHRRSEPGWRGRPAPEPLIPEPRNRPTITILRPVYSVRMSAVDPFEVLFRMLEETFWRDF